MNNIEVSHSQFKTKLLQLSKIIEDALVHYIEKWPIESTTLREAITYSVKSGGKRIRPVLMLAIAKLCNQPYALVLPYACALELIHTFSLVHDDLPCMDDDDFRRGVPTCHKVFGEAMAVLAGDAMLNMAYQIMLEEAAQHHGATEHIDAAFIIAKATGESGMISGQVLDLEAEGKEITYEQLEKIHFLKTGALLTAPIMSAAALCKMREEEKTALSIFAKNLGLTFQIMDDILDVVGEEKKLGKPVGSDAENSKSTFVKLIGIEKSKETVARLSAESLQQLNVLQGDTWFLQELSAFLAKREY